jgi:hypothetical protein
MPVLPPAAAAGKGADGAGVSVPLAPLSAACCTAYASRRCCGAVMRLVRVFLVMSYSACRDGGRGGGEGWKGQGGDETGGDTPPMGSGHLRHSERGAYGR